MPRSRPVEYLPTVQNLAVVGADAVIPVPWESQDIVDLLGVTVTVKNLGSGPTPKFTIFTRKRTPAGQAAPRVHLLTDDELSSVAVGKSVGWVPDAEVGFDPANEELCVNITGMPDGVVDIDVKYSVPPDAGAPPPPVRRQQIPPNW